MRASVGFSSGFCFALTALSFALLSACATNGSTTPAQPAAAATPPAGAATGLAPLVVYGEQGNVAPNTLFLGTPANWAFIVPKNGLGSMNAGNINAEPAKVGAKNGVKVTWTGGQAQIYSQSKTTNDQFDYIDANSALVFDAVIHKAPEDQVLMRVDCRYPCMGIVDTTEYFKKQELEKQFAVKVPLACFEKAGAKFAVVNTPWLITTNKAFAMSIANVRYVPGAAKDADAMKCGG